jgi:predicted DNA-binding transcriptional regulator AlpA
MSSAGKLITPTEVCDLLRVARSTLYRLRAAPGFPKLIRLAERTVRYRLSEILAWQERGRAQ